MPKTAIPFRGFDEAGQVRIYDHGVLPHWRQDNCTYFVTFRLADSIPLRVEQEFENERKKWLKARGIEPDDANWKQRFARLPLIERRQYELFFGRMLNQALDECHGSCVLRDPAIGARVAVALDHFHGQRVQTGDFVVIPKHIGSAGFRNSDVERERSTILSAAGSRRYVNSLPFLTGSPSFTRGAGFCKNRAELF